MPNTPARGFPYPAATDPVAQGAAAIQALATRADLSNQSVYVGRTNPMAVPPGGPWTLMYFDFSTWADWAGLSGSNSIKLPAAGRYRVTADGVWSGQSGGISPSMMRVMHRDGAAGIKRDIYGNAPGLNTGSTVSAVVNAAAVDDFILMAWSGAGAAGGGLLCSMCVERLGPLSASLRERLGDVEHPEAKPAPPPELEATPNE